MFGRVSERLRKIDLTARGGSGRPIEGRIVIKAREVGFHPNIPGISLGRFILEAHPTLA